MANLAKMLQAKLDKRAELNAAAQASEDANELRSILQRMQDLNADIDDLRAAEDEAPAEDQPAEDQPADDNQDEAPAEDQPADDNQDEAPAEDQPADDESDSRTAAVNMEENNKMETRNFEQGVGFVSRANTANVEQDNKRNDQGKALREGRSVTVAASNIALPSYTADTINPNFQEVSDLLGAVNVLQLPGGEAYRQPYEAGTPAGDYTAEGGDGATADMTFGYADIAKAKITAYSEITEEIEKLPEAPYADVVLAGIGKSIRRKLAAEIMNGAGGTNKLVGIFDATHATAIDTATDLEVATIDNTTLDNIIYSYGGSEAVEGSCVLILSKKDLAAFAKLRNTDGSKFHTIIPAANGGSGTIDGYPYIINGACAAVTDSATSTGAYCMAYGNLKNYQLTIFSEMDVTKSTDYKFKEGMICHRGVVFAGGNVVAKNGFIRVKKATAVG